MRKLLLLLSILCFLGGCDQTTTLQKGDPVILLLPQAKEISASPKELLLSEQSKLYAADSQLYPLLDLCASQLEKLTGIAITVSRNKNRDADIHFSIDPNLKKEEYKLEINEQITLRGGSYAALSMANTSLLQLAEVEGGRLKFPVAKIRDYPDASYRGLMIDLARKWHGIENLKKLIDLASFYKINYLHLHFTDDQSYTLPSKRFSKLPTSKRHYSFDEMKELEAYSQIRGITIIPEIDVPGHSSVLVKKYPEIFAISKHEENPRIINMGREEVYEALDYLVGEWAAVFQASPYFHIGGDEANFYQVLEDPDVRAYMKSHNLREDVHELYRHFLTRMNEIVKSHGKQMCVWEGFSKRGKIEIPRDIIVFEFETNKYLPDELVRDGYTLVNTSWKPLYVVNEKKWSPKTIYEWNIWRWENWWEGAPSIQPIQLEKSPLVIGGQMCAWEQPARAELPSLRMRLPVLAERVWHTETEIPFEEFRKRLEGMDKRLSALIGDSRQDSLLLGYDFSE